MLKMKKAQVVLVLLALVLSAWSVTNYASAKRGGEGGRGDGPVVYVKDASRAVGVAQKLISATGRSAYVADIKAEFDATNKAYFDELKAELGDEMEFYSNLFKSKEEIEEEIAEIKEMLCHFNTENVALFSRQINEITDKAKVLDLRTIGLCE